MAAKHINLCILAESFLNSSVLPVSVTIERKNVIEHELSSTQTTRVIVTPGLKALGANVDANTRMGILKEYTIRIHVINFLDQAMTEEDTMFLLMEAIEDLFTYQDLGEFSFLTFSSDANPEPPFDVNLDQDSQLFYGMITVHYLGD